MKFFGSIILEIIFGFVTCFLRLYHMAVFSLLLLLRLFCYLNLRWKITATHSIVDIDYLMYVR